jgi:uncharacterized membrane protein
VTRYEALRFVHVLAAMVWLGGAAIAQVFALRMKHAEPGHRLGFAKDQRAAARSVFVPAQVVLLGTGVWMVADAPAIGFSQAWIVIGIAVVVVGLVVATVVVPPRVSDAIGHMEAGRGPEAAATMRRIGLVVRGVLVLLVVSVWVMLQKPGL